MAKTDLISRGTLICDLSNYSSFQNTAGGAGFSTTVHPNGATKSMYVDFTENVEAFGQIQLSPYLTPGIAAAAHTGLLIEVYNPNLYPCDFYVDIFDSAAVRCIRGNMAVEPGGWHLCFIPFTNWALNTIDTATAIRFVRVVRKHPTASGWTQTLGDRVYFGRVYLNPTQRPVFLLCTDDARETNVVNGASFPTGYPASGGSFFDICNYYKMRATAYVVPSWIGTGDFLSWAQLGALKAAGWTIGSHSMTHPAAEGNHGLKLLGPYGVTQSYTGAAADDSAIYTDIVSAIVDMEARGFNDARHFALPQGGWDKYVRTACLRSGLRSVRGISASNRSFPVRGAYMVGGGNQGDAWQPGFIDLPTSLQIDGGDSIATMQGYIDNVIKIGATGTCYVHSITADIATKFDAVCSYLKTKQEAGLVRVMTVADYYDSLADWSGWTLCDASLPTSGQLCKSHALPVGTSRITVFPGVASASQIAEAGE